MKFQLTIDCGNAAFDPSAPHEVARILTRLANQLSAELEPDARDDFTLCDYNGNRVGIAQFAENATSDNPKRTDPVIVTDRDVDIIADLEGICDGEDPMTVCQYEASTIMAGLRDPVYAAALVEGYEARPADYNRDDQCTCDDMPEDGRA